VTDNIYKKLSKKNWNRDKKTGNKLIRAIQKQDIAEQGLEVEKHVKGKQKLSSDEKKLKQMAQDLIHIIKLSRGDIESLNRQGDDWLSRTFQSRYQRYKKIVPALREALKGELDNKLRRQIEEVLSNYDR
jgi:hypothetical protein